ncbi:MAG: hypothetical protein ACXWZ4_00340 [Gemmatirosa sp.]
MPEPSATPTPRAPTPRARALVALLVGVGAVVLMRAFVDVTGRRTDFDVVWQGARYLLAGQDPWAMIGPGRAFEWVSPLYYPGTALVAALPLASLPLDVARALFVGGSAALLAWAVTREAWWRLLVFASVPFLHAACGGQWSPLVAAAFLLPALGVVAALKPTVGLATLAAARTQRAQVVAIAAGAALVLVSVLVAPSWPTAWRAAIADAPHMSAPIAHWRVGAPLVLLALLRWRRPEARWLLALACVPQSTVPYEGVYHMLIPASRAGMLAMTVLSYVAGFAHYQVVLAATSTAQLQHRAGDVLVLCFYLPALAMVLRRPNEGPVPAWLARAVSAVPRLRPAVG